MSDVKASVPEPAPRNEGEDVTGWLLRFIKVRGGGGALPPSLIDLVKARRAFGIAKYGQPLMSGDGRDTVEDLRQEAGDALQYVFKCAMTGEGEPEGFRELGELFSMISEMCEELSKTSAPLRAGGWPILKAKLLEAEFEMGTLTSGDDIFDDVEGCRRYPSFGALCEAYMQIDGWESTGLPTVEEVCSE